MQTLTRQSSTNGNHINKQSRTIVFMAILLFAVAGLMSGFAVGAFIHTNKTAQTSTANQRQVATATTRGHGKTPVATSPTGPVRLGYPIIEQASFQEIADGNTSYTFSAHAVDQSKDTGHGNPVRASGITFKIWLVQRIPAHADFVLPDKSLQDINNIQNPLTGTAQDTPLVEVPGLTFDPTTPQTQLSNAQGQTTWHYKISPSVAPGNYDFILLTDWNGIRYSWRWMDIMIMK